MLWQYLKKDKWRGWVEVRFHETLFLEMLYVEALDNFLKQFEIVLLVTVNNDKKYQLRQKFASEL